MSRKRTSLPLHLFAMAIVLSACGESPATPAAPGARPPARASAAAGSLQWFGYAAGADEDIWLNGTDSYANVGEIVTDANPSSTWATQRITALTQHDMKAIVDLGQLLWFSPGFHTLYNDYTARWNSWKQANASVLTSDKVLAFVIHDEPFWTGADITQYEAAAAMVKRDFPWAKLILIEAAVGVADPGSNFAQNAWRVSTVDWIGVDRFWIDPRTDPTFLSAVSTIKSRFPGRKMVYVMDGYWDQTHADSMGISSSVATLQPIATWWYDAARADPDAVMLIPFIWSDYDGGTSSRWLPPDVLKEHTRIGREITGRARTQLYAPTGAWTTGSDGYATGWACDPDGAWGETVTVRMYVDGAFFTLGSAASPDTIPSFCRTGGYFHSFRFNLGAAKGRRITATVQDLDGGEVPLPGNCKDAPACIWYPNSFLPKGSSTLSATGLVTGWACDRDAPAVSIQVRVAANVTDVGTYPANQVSEAAINSQCNGGTAHRFSVQLPAWTKGQNIYVYAIDTMSGQTGLPAQTGTSRIW